MLFAMRVTHVTPFTLPYHGNQHSQHPKTYKKTRWNVTEDSTVQGSCETETKFNDSVMTQFNEGKGYRGIRAVKTLKFENTRGDAKKCCSH